MSEAAEPANSWTIAHRSVGMAIGALASRITGFVRTAVLGAVLGAAAVVDAYATATMLPGIFYEILLGGALAGILVPHLIHAQSDDPDNGRTYEQRLVTLALVVLAVTAALATAATPLLVDVLSGATAPAANRGLVSTLAYVVLPAIFFYGLGAVLTAVLNARGYFAVPTWSPIANNLILITTGLVFLALPGPAHLIPQTITPVQVAVLGIGNLLGVVAQAAALLPALHRANFRWRLRLGLGRLHLRELGRTTAWLLCYFAVSQVGVLVVLAIAKRAGDLSAPGPFIYNNGWLLLMMGYGIVAFPIITALMPVMSATTASRSSVATSSQLGTRMFLVTVTPVAAGLAALGTPIAVLLFEWHRYTHTEALETGRVVMVAGLCLLPYAITQLQTFAFFALRDARTPALLNLPVVVVRIGLDLLFYLTLSAEHLVVALMISNGVTFLLAAAVGARLLNRRLRVTAAPSTTWLPARALVAGTVGAVAAAGAVAAIGILDLSAKASSAVGVAAGALTLVLAFAAVMHFLRVPVLDQVAKIAGLRRRV